MSGKTQSIVESWLSIATRDLCPAAKERIALEITAHFEEAVAAHLEEGLPSLEAKLKAREELGDAEVAGKRFRKRHLTLKEFEFAEGKREAWLNSTWRSPLLWLLVIGVFCWWMDASGYDYLAVCACVLLFPINWFSRRAARPYYTDAATKKLGLSWICQLLIFSFLATVLLSPLSWIWLLIGLFLPNRLWFSILYKLFLNRKSVTDQNS